jgi:hypothetical protein
VKDDLVRGGQGRSDMSATFAGLVAAWCALGVGAFWLAMFLAWTLGLLGGD